MYRRMRTRCLILLLSGEHITQHILKIATSGKPRVYAQSNVNPHRANILHKYYSFEINKISPPSQSNGDNVTLFQSL